MKRAKVISLLFSLFYTCFIPFSHAQWIKQSPIPSGHELTDICFINPDTGWIFGENGTVFRTNDGGQSWTDQSLPSQGRINSGLFLGNETGYVALSAGGTESEGEIYKSTDGGYHWELEFSDPSSAIRDLSFINPDTGWVLGYYRQVYPVNMSWNFFLKTEDGGEHWQVLDFLQESHFTRINFIDDTTGYIAGAGTPNLMKTIDGGRHWQSVYQPTNSGLTDVFFTDIDNGYTCGNNFYFTHNAGASWGYTYCYYANSIGMYDAFNGWTVTMNKVFKVIDGGNVLEYQFTADKSPLVGISAVDSSTAYIIGKNVTIYGTKNGGETWQELSNGTDKSLHSIFFLDGNVGWAGGTDHTLLHTTDGGRRWIFNGLSASPGTITDLQFINPETGWFVNEDIYWSRDSGVTWDKASGISNPVSDLYFIDDQSGWGVGTDGKLFKSTDGGLNWEEKSSGMDKDLYAVYFIDEEKGWIAGEGIIESTVDGGESWEMRYLGDEVFSKIQFIDESTGYILADDHFFKTESGGEEWAIIIPEGLNGSEPLKDLFFVDQSSGYLSGNDFLLKTTDGGATWVSIPGFADIQSNAIFFINKNKGWMVGEEGAIYQTETGGAESAGEEIGGSDAFQISIFPNPAKEILNFKFSILNSGMDCTLFIYDLFGKEVFTQPCIGTQSIDVNKLPSGIYLAVIKNNDLVLGSRKFLICR
jgi:photosystem II stability/assembly factor-like uncharacterized protein